jgi:hypothetical protein
VEIRGFLEAYFETGTEGVIWSVLDPGLPGYDGLHTLEDGDELHVLDGTGGILWEGVVRLDRNTGRLPRWPGGEPVQQAVLGLWVHGLQEGMDPEAWGRMFTEERRAILRHACPAGGTATRTPSAALPRGCMHVSPRFRRHAPKNCSGLPSTHGSCSPRAVSGTVWPAPGGLEWMRRWRSSAIRSRSS